MTLVSYLTRQWPLICSIDGMLFWTAAGAIGSAGAAISAVGIAIRGGVRERKERERRQNHRAKMLAIDASQYATTIRIQIVRARKTFSEAERFLINDQGEAFAARLRIGAADHLPRGTELDDLPSEFAEAIAELAYLTGCINQNVDALPKLSAGRYEDLEFIQSLRLDVMLDSAQRGLAAAVQQMVPIIPALAVINWLDRGDGTMLEPELPY